MFPPIRLPVFVMGCCIGYMRILANKPPTSADTHERYDHIMSQRPFLVSRNDVTTPAIIYGFIVTSGILFHFIAPTLSLCFRVFAEPILPLLFFDWILNLTKESDASIDVSRSAASNPSVVERFLQSKFMLFMGKISFSFYACHLITSQCTAMLIHYFEDGRFGLLIPSWAIAIVFPLSIFVGWLITTYIEIPMQKWLLSSARQAYHRVEEESSYEDSIHQLAPASNLEITTTNNLPILEDTKISTY